MLAGIAHAGGQQSRCAALGDRARCRAENVVS